MPPVRRSGDRRFLRQSSRRYSKHRLNFKPVVRFFLGMTDHLLLWFDKDGLRARMKQLGTTRRWYKGGYYWDYKPDFHPGEVVTL